MKRPGLAVLCKAVLATGLAFLLIFTGVDRAYAAAKRVNVTLYVDSATLAAKALKATGLKPSKAKWASSKKSVVTVTKRGKATAKKAGKAVVTAKQGKKAWKFVITVKKVSINKKALTLDVDKSAVLKLVGDGLRSAGSSNSKVVSVALSGKGAAWTITAQTAGTATITLKSKKGKSYTCKVTVRSIDVTPGRKVVRIPVPSAIQTLRFVAPEDGIYVLESLDSGDTTAFLCDEQDNVLVTDYDGGEGNNFLVRHELVGGSTYKYRISYYENGAIGSMVLSLSREITEGSLEAKIARANTCQRLRFTPDEDGTYVLHSTGSDDTKGCLYDESGNELVSDDNGGEGTNFKLSYVLNAGQTYYYEVGYYDSGVAGTLSLTLAKV